MPGWGNSPIFTRACNQDSHLPCSCDRSPRAPRADCPPVAGVVRGELHIGGWIARPIARGSSPDFDDSAGCTVTYVMRSDIKGSIPAFVTRQVVAQQVRRRQQRPAEGWGVVPREAALLQARV